MREHANLANLMTTGSLAAGFVALVLAADGRLVAAAAAVVVAALLDSLDGFVARRSSTDGRFGSELDSLADLVAFGVAPALMVYEATLHALPGLGAGAALAFVLAGAWRLARFSIVHDPDRFVGLPIPPAGLAVAAAAALALPAGAALAVVLVLALTMVSAVPFPTLPTLGRLAPPRRRTARSRRRPVRLRRPARRRRRLPQRGAGREAADAARARAARSGAPPER